MNIKRFGSHKENPSVLLIKDIRLVPRTVKNKSQIVVDKNSGQHWEQIPIDTLTTVADTRTFIKVYQQSVVSLKEMSNAAIKLYCFILFKLKPNKDYLTITYKNCSEFCAFNNKITYYNGLEQLLEQEFIFKADDPHQYWINVNLLFNGNRLNLINKDDIINGKEEDEEKPLKVDYVSNFENEVIKDE